MSGRPDGTAHVVSPQRLANFEDEDLDLALAPPPRPRRDKPAPAPADGPPTRARRKTARKATPEPVASPGGATEAAGTAVEADAARAPAAAPEVALKGPEQRVRRSNVHIPVRLLGPITDKTEREGLSNGELIIAAIEQTFDRLPDLIHPAPTTGGNLFDSRRSRVSRSTDGPLTPLNYGLREVDFQTLDRLVEQLRASSRGHLITAALTAYFKT
jgi:hypothetical protein